MNGKFFVHRAWLRLALIVVLVGMCSYVFAAQQWDGKTTTEGGLPVVMNLGSAINPDQVITPEEKWRLGGGDDDDDEALIGFVKDAVVDQEGNCFLLDSILNNVLVIGPHGEIERTIGREGDGPGEFRNAQQLLLMPGGLIGVRDLMPSQVVTLHQDGSPSDMFHAGTGQTSSEGMNHIMKVASAGNTVVVGKTYVSFGESEVKTVSSLAAYNPDGSQKYSIVSEESTQSSNQAISIGGDSFTRDWSLCPDGRIIVFSEPFDYKMSIYNVDGEQIQTIGRKYDSVKRPDDEIAKDKEEAEAMSARFGGIPVREVPKYFRDITRVYPRNNGDIWVSNSQGHQDRPEKSIGYFDVFNVEGKFTKRILINADYDHKNDLYTIRDNWLFVFKEGRNEPARTSTFGGGGNQMVMMSGGDNTDEDDDEEARPFEVICYKLVPQL